jgi:hypothetical protein
MPGARLLLPAGFVLLPVFLVVIFFVRTAGQQDTLLGGMAQVSQKGTRLAPNEAATESSGPTKARQFDALIQRARKLFDFTSPSERLELMRLLQALGEHGSDALPVLREALAHADQEVRRAAMRGLAATQSQEAISMLQTYLSDSIAIEESTEAALALATMANQSVSPLLQGALEQSKDPVLREHIVDALVSRPPTEVDLFVDSFLARPDVAPYEKQNLLQMSGLNNTKPAEFLAAQIQNPDELLRLGAYQGLALVSESRQTQHLMARVASENDSYNRALVYEALGNQIDANPQALGALADAETDSHARLRALKAWTESAGRENLPLAGDSASSARVSELQRTALSHPEFAERRVALFALGLVRQDARARAAIEKIVQGSSSDKIRELAQGILKSSK